MSSNLVESTGEGSNRKRSPSPINIRKYLVKPSVSSLTHTTTTTAAKQPLASPDENVMKNQQQQPTTTTTPAAAAKITTTIKSTEDKLELNEKSTSTTKKAAVSTKVQSRIVDLIGKTKKSASPLARPSLKRSYSATTMLDNVDKSWMSSTKKKLDDSTEAVSLLTYINWDKLTKLYFLVRPSYTKYIRYGICSSYNGFTRN